MTVIKAIEFPNKEFNSKEELFQELKANEGAIISLKKAEPIKSDYIVSNANSEEGGLTKALDMKDGFIYPVINTTNLMDSHNDVHIPKIWNKSLKEQQGKVYYVSDHKLELDSVIAFPKDVTMALESIAWKDLGFNYEGETQALIFKVSVEKIKSAKALEIIEEKIPIQHSIRMQYVNVFLALNSDAKEDKQYKKVWDKYINEVANKEQAEEKGYFWAVTEAKIFKEGSMVLFGSNEATPMQYPKNYGPPEGTQEKDESGNNTNSDDNKRKILLSFV